MTNRQIGFHLGAVALLILLGIGAYWIMHSAYAVPSLVRALENDDSKTRRHAAASLARLGAQAMPAVEALLRLAQSDRPLNDRTTAAGALAEISPAAANGLLPRLIEELRHHDAQTRYQAGMVLTELGPLARPAIPALVAAARDPDDLVRRWAITALGRIGIATSDSLQALVAALGDTSEVVRHDAQLAFSYDIVPHTLAPAAIAAIRRIGEDPRYAANANNALRRLEQQRPVKTELWIQQQSLKSGAVASRYALQALMRMGAAAAPAQADIAGLLNDERPLNRYLAIEALAAIGPAAAPAVPALRERLQDDDALVREAAKQTLATIGDKSSNKESP